MYDTVSIGGLLAILWTLTSLAIVLSIGRFAIRYANRKRLFWDDASHLLSLVFLIGLAATYTKGFPYSLRIVRIQTKKEKAPPLTDPFYHDYLQLRVAVTLLVFLVLWTVKATFLIFYRILFDVSTTFIRMWWFVVAITFVSFWVCIGSTLTICGSASDLYNFQECSKPSTLHAIRATYKYWCALNVLTDLAVMAVPMYMLWGLQMRRGQKIGIACVFCLGFVVAIFDILRTVESLVSGTFSGVALWSSMEVSIAVIVSSLPTYRTLFGIKTRKGTVKYISWDRYRRFDKHNNQKRSGSSSDGNTNSSKAASNMDPGALESQTSAPSRNGSSTLPPIPLAHFGASS